MLKKWFRPLTAFRPVTAFYVNLSLLLSLVISSIYLGLYVRNNELLLGTVKEQAASYFDLIVAARRWNAGYGGVYVQKKPGVGTNPYLVKVGVQPDVVASDGRVFTMRNPALMTREISETLLHGGARFHITSLRPLNPGNEPDAFERRALAAFEGGAREVSGVENVGGEPFFRYMAPLSVEASCLPCHGSFGYRVGDIRGGIAVSIPFGAVQGRLRQNRFMIAGLSVFTLALILTASYFMLGQLVGKLDEAQRRLRELSITDELTGLGNRRHVMLRLEEEFRRARRLNESLSVLILDLDRFKDVNDRFGHPFGDVVLRAAAGRLAASLRGYDTVGRYGGEEFFAVLPETDLAGALALAERVRSALASEPVCDGPAAVTVTASVGCAALSESDDGIRTLIARADDALYRAKRNGRDRVEA